MNVTAALVLRATLPMLALLPCRAVRTHGSDNRTGVSACVLPGRSPNPWGHTGMGPGVTPQASATKTGGLAASVIE